MRGLYDRLDRLKSVLGGGEAGKGEYVALAVEGEEDGRETRSPLADTGTCPGGEKQGAALNRLLLFATLSTLFFLSFYLLPPPPSPPSSSSISSASPPTVPTRVGRRRFPSLYHGRGCSSSELVEAVGRAKVRPDGASRTEYEQEGNELDLSGFEFSYDIEGCPPPHIFSPEEACDLVSSFNGLFLRGDSLTRQFAQGLFLLLTSSFDQVRSKHAECKGNKLFTNGRECKFDSVFDVREMRGMRERCPGAAVVYDQVWKFESDADPVPKPKKGEQPDYATPLLNGFHRFLNSLPEKQQRYSPVFVDSTGIHYHWRVNETLSTHILPFSRNTSLSLPRPIPFFSSYPAVPPNKPAQYLQKQGPEVTREYNRAMRAAIDELGTGESVEGEWGWLEWYNSTEGAWSYDGTHYDTQVALERALVFLNVLDAVWAEVVERGGLVE
ncbi:hypothetical protein JCM8097_002310 [Rhodosporidiobolus ruineniae]